MKRPRVDIAFFIMLIVLVLDQVSKYFTRLHTQVGDSFVLGQKWFGETFRFTHLQNDGAAFSISPFGAQGNRVFFIVVPILAVFFILYLLYNARHRLQVFAFGLVLGGAIGNLIDRIFHHGKVTDFVDVDFPNIFGLERWPVFNVADSAIFIAMVLLIIDMIFIRDKEAPAVPAEPNPADNNS